MANKKTDPISPWFIAAEELGEYIGIRFGRLSPGASEPEWIFLRHTDFDGIGGFAEILRAKGAEIPSLPQIKHPAPPSTITLVKNLLKSLGPRKRVRWGALERGASVNGGSQPPQAVAWFVFDEDTTTQIRRVCRKTGVTVNSFLLKHLTKAIRPFLHDHSSTVPWMIPVNMRGKVVRTRDVENHSSYVGVKVRSYETVQDVHRTIYAAMGRGEHWANWHGYKLGRFLTAGMRRHLITTEKCMSQWNLGSFSNLGDWDSEKRITNPDCGGAWLFCPPVLRCQLLGTGCVTFQNRLSLTIQAHSDLTNSSTVPKAWVQAWVKEIEIDLASALAEPAAAPWLAAG
jgi:NRPS condensation-like uncharacterized protein